MREFSVLRALRYYSTTGLMFAASFGFKSHLLLQIYPFLDVFPLSPNTAIFGLSPSFSLTLGTLFCLPTGNESHLRLLAGLALIGFARIS